MAVRYLRIWTSDDGESHVEDLVPSYRDIENYAVGVPTVAISESLKAGVVHFVKFPSGWVGDWHPTPTRQKFIVVKGRLGGLASDGAEILVEVGDCGLLEDTHGKGHKSWVTGDEDAVVVMVTLQK
jgi:hypothetical protein